MPSLSASSLAVLAPALALAPVAALALTPQEIFAKVSPAVWVVRAHHAQNGSTALGSAVVIAPRLLVTACHVVAGATAVEVARDAGKSVVPIATVTRDPDRTRDLCLLSASADVSGAPAAIAPIGEVKVGEPAYAIGAPLGLELTLTDGLVSALRHANNEPMPDIQTSAAIAPGSSGGGLFDAQGRLIGVTVAIASKETDNLAFAYPAEWVVQLPARIDAARHRWSTALTAHGVALGADGEPAASGFAPVADIAAVPTVGKPAQGVADAYKQFLLLSTPRAFVLTSDGRWGAVSDADALTGLFEDCAAKQVTCQLYAVDDAVVWKGIAKPLP
jgi:S1-C subfamily serine protease